MNQYVIENSRQSKPDIFAPIWAVMAFIITAIIEIVVQTKSPEFYKNYDRFQAPYILNLLILLIFYFPLINLVQHFQEKSILSRENFHRDSKNRNKHNLYWAKAYLSTFQLCKYFRRFIVSLIFFYSLKIVLGFLPDFPVPDPEIKILLTFLFIIPEFFNISSGVYMLFMFRSSFNSTILEETIDDNGMLSQHKYWLIALFIIFCIFFVHLLGNPTLIESHKISLKIFEESVISPNFFCISLLGGLVNTLGMTLFLGRLSAMDIYYDYTSGSNLQSNFVNYGVKVAVPLYAILQIIYPFILMNGVIKLEGISEYSGPIKFSYFILVFFSKLIFLSFLFQIIRENFYTKFVVAIYCLRENIGSGSEEFLERLQLTLLFKLNRPPDIEDKLKKILRNEIE